MNNQGHMKYMKAALQQAQLALESSEPPFGCVLINEKGEICLSDHDRIKELQDMSAHGETLILKRACRELNIDSLAGYTLFTTVEPCAMCFTTGWLNGLSKIVFGASMQDIDNVTDGSQKEVLITCSEVNKRSGNKIVITGGILKSEAIEIFSRYAYI